jgi:crotonobetainyl-CoA:carnitine CoA-transferase CaiB-like acyl-CoA transferase
MSTGERDAIARLWNELGGEADGPDRCVVSGAGAALASPYRVGDLAVATVAAATLATADLLAGPARTVTVDRRLVAAAFTSERWVRVDGGRPPDPWDPIAGDYRAGDGWIRLHTNYRHHRAAAIGVVGRADDREAVAALVAEWEAERLEDAIAAAGGAAAAMRSPHEWSLHPQATWLGREPVVAIESVGSTSRSAPPRGSDAAIGRRGALDGVRVVDLTRVIAGPVCTRFLAAHGATVLRLDPPGFEEVPALVYDVTAGKRTAFVDVGRPADRATVERLLAGADVVVQGYRPGALAAHGLAPEQIAERHPHLVIGVLSAWGHSGPWAERRGFDSLVQMATGIADTGMRRAGADHPVPLPAQALDHGSGYLLAAGIARALLRRSLGAGGNVVRVSLARTAAWLASLGGAGDEGAEPLTADEVARWMVTTDGPLGQVATVRCPGDIAGSPVGWSTPPVALGTHAPAWPDGGHPVTPSVL